MSSIFVELKSVGFETKVSTDVVFAGGFFHKGVLSKEVKIVGPDIFAR
jgi:hypothetical protein